MSGRAGMARLVCIHEIELAEGADAVEFERLFTEGATQPELPGWKTRLLQGDRGERAGKYAILFEIESPEARDRYFPAEGQGSEDLDRFNAENPAAAEVWQRLQAFVADSEVTTDYLVVVE
jgi:hypothetical protein